MKKNLLFLLFVFFFSINAFSVVKYSNVPSGNWSAPGTWVGGTVPSAGDIVFIQAGHTILVDINTPIVMSVHVLGNMNIFNGNTSDLKLTDSLVIETSGVLNNMGSIEHMNGAGSKRFIINGNGQYIHDPYNNVALDESIFYACAESFSNTSSLTIKKWFDLSIPVGDPTRVQISNFGNLTLSVNTMGIRWNQKGYFSVNRIKGTFNITNGIILMDDGQGATVQLILQAVNISGTGNLIIRSQFSSPFTLTTGAFTDTSTSALPTQLTDTTFTLFTWNATGNVRLGHHFIGMSGTGIEPGGDLRINITGNLLINGTQPCLFVTQCDAPFRLAVTGSTTISGSPSKVRFLDGNTGLMNFTTNDFIIAGGNDITLMGGGVYGVVPKCTGIPTVTINNDFLITAPSSSYILNSDTNAQKLRVAIGRDFAISNNSAQLIAANHLGANTFKTTRHFTINGGQFLGEMDTANIAIDSVIIGGNFSFYSGLNTNYCIMNNSKGNTVIQTAGNFIVSGSGTASGQGVYGILDGSGNLNFTVGGNYEQSGPSQFNAIYITKDWILNGTLTFAVTGTFDQDGGIFKGMHNKVSSSTGTINFSASAIDFDGGNFSGFHASNITAISTYNITNLCKINFAAATDTFSFVGVALTGSVICNLTNNVTIGGSMVLSGANGRFISSYGFNGESYTIAGGMTISGGINTFNPMPIFGSTPHKVYINIGGSLTVNGGNTVLSQIDDSLIVNVNGALNITSGTLTLKGKNGNGIVNVKDAFSMTGGTLYLHNNSINNSSEATVLTINSDGDNSGDFTHTGGSIIFDTHNFGNPAQVPTIVVKSPNYYIGGNGVMTRNTDPTIDAWGILRFARNGTINFHRTSNTHNIQQVQQYVESGTTVDVLTGDLQIASWSQNWPATFPILNVIFNGRLALGTHQIKSNQILPYSGMTIYGTLAIQHPNGLYNGTASAAIDASGGMTYWLQLSSTVEYYGAANQVITGINVGVATMGIFHKYYNLDINMMGSAWAYPTNTPNINSVYVRHHLNLNSGELNLDNDHSPANGGRNIIIEDSTSGAITQAAGYIRSETEDGSGKVRWNIGRALGAHIFPFGYSAIPADRIPFTFAIPSGDADTVSISTYHTNNLNIAYPPTVTHVRNNSGADNSANTVDRFWYIGLTGTANNANLTFSVLNSAAGSSVGEMNNPILINTLRAQRWIAALNSWEVNYQGTQSNPITNGTLVTGATLFPNWWTLSGNNNPLPVNLLSFSGSCEGKSTKLNWVTASEINNDRFIIQRSADGVNYETIGKVQGVGNSTYENSYSYTDEYPLAEMAYYKLLQVDFDGRSEEFGPVIVKNCETQPALDVVVAGQDAGNTNLLIQAPYAGNYNVTVLNIQGQVIINTETFIPEGSSIVPLASDNFITGIYHVRIQGEKDMITKKVFIKKD